MWATEWNLDTALEIRKEEGIEDGLLKAARAMKEKGFDMSTIVEVTELPIDTIAMNLRLPPLPRAVRNRQTNHVPVDKKTLRILEARSHRQTFFDIAMYEFTLNEALADMDDEGFNIGVEKAARNMIKNNFDINFIAEATGLTADAVLNLQPINEVSKEEWIKIGVMRVASALKKKRCLDIFTIAEVTDLHINIVQDL